MFGFCENKKEEVNIENPKPVFKIDTDEERKYHTYNVWRGSLHLGCIQYHNGLWAWKGNVAANPYSPDNSRYCPIIEAEEFCAIADKIKQLNEMEKIS